MCSVVVVVKDVRVQQPLQMSFIQDDHMVKQIPAAVANPTLANPVLPWTCETGPLWSNAKALHCVDDFLIEARVAIKDQVAGRRVVGECLPQLLNNPGTARMLGHVAMKDTPSIMRDDEEAVKHAERQRRHGKEIHRSDGFPMIAQKGRPSLCRIRIPWRFPHPAQDGPFRNVEAKHLQFAMNPWRAPGWIVRNHAEDEFAEFNADALPARANGMAREPGPIQLEAGPVPSHNGLRLNENQCLPPPGPEAPQYHPEKSVGNSKPRMRTPPFQDSKLLPESQILQEEIAARTKEHDHRNKQQLHQAQHARSCTRRQSRLDTGLIVMIQQQIAILASDNSRSGKKDSAFHRAAITSIIDESLSHKSKSIDVEV